MGLVKRISILSLFTGVMCMAINIDDITHNNRELFFVNPTVGDIKLKTRKGSIKEAYVIADSKNVRMDILYRDDYFDYFVADLGSLDTTVNYYFVVKNATDSLIYPPLGRLQPASRLFTTPGWANGKVYYLVFIDGFNNGDIINDPKHIKPWGSKPEGWSSYGGDFKGITKQLPYLDTLNFDVLVLAPIFSAPSNHKYDFFDFGAIDPAFGDTTELKTLINEIHKRGKKIIMTFVMTHTGSDFPAFIDILRNGTESKYLNWYLVKSTPVKLSSAYYNCWRSDAHFPQLDLKEPQVKNYLFGYIEYWHQYGFDGFYIGEDYNINSDFMRELRSYLKVKYPNLLLVGSDSRILTGDGFDGSLNIRFTELLVNYFAKKTITTSQFDQEIHKILFWNPAQSNMINLLSPSSFDFRIKALAAKDDLKNLYAFVFTFCGSPLLIYGDEIGMSDVFPLNFGSFHWDAKNQDRNLLQEITKLINIRKTNPQIASKYFFTLYANDINQVYAFDRGGIITVINSGESSAYVALPAWDGTYLDLTSGEKVTVFQQRLKLSVSPRSYRILRREF